jgi:enoyl-CoA hydratase/3-hydroxyacyl-CoA dehydrogenase
MNEAKIETVAVIGAGDMGHGIAEVAPLAGFAVRWHDIERELLDRGAARIMDGVRKLVEKAKVSPRPITSRAATTADRTSNPTWPFRRNQVELFGRGAHRSR